MACSAVTLMYAARSTTFAYDDWNFVLQRQGWGLRTLLTPHNEHLSLVPLLVYKLTFETLGLHHYGSLRAVLVALDLLNGLLLFAYARPRIGAWPAMAITAPLMVMGPAYWDLIWAFQIGFLSALAAGLGALLAMDRRSRRGDVVASALLCVSLASSGIGLPIVAGAAVEVLLRPDRRRRAWVVGIPIVLYALWYVGYGRDTAKLSNVPAIPAWIIDAAGPAAGAITGVGSDYGILLAAALAAFAVHALLRPGPLDPRLTGLLVMPLVLWATTALARADTDVSPGETRYLYPGGLLVVLLAVELARGRFVRGRACALLVVAIGAGALANLHTFSGPAASVRSLSTSTKGVLSAIEVAGSSANPDLAPASGQPQITVGPYLAAVRHYGSSPAYSPAQIAQAPRDVRAIADAVLLQLRGAVLTPVGATLPQTAHSAPTASVTAGVLSQARGCLRFTPQQPDAQVVARVPTSGLLIRASRQTGIEVRFRRFADTLGRPLQIGVQPGAADTVRLPVDRSPRPWRIGLRGSAPFTVCSLR